MFVLNTLVRAYTRQKTGRLYSCFVDFSKAFDRVWWDGLYFKMLKSQIGGNFIATIKSMYYNMCSSVKTVNGLTTSSNCIKEFDKEKC